MKKKVPRAEIQHDNKLQKHAKLNNILIMDKNIRVKSWVLKTKKWQIQDGITEKLGEDRVTW